MVKLYRYFIIFIAVSCSRYNSFYSNKVPSHIIEKFSSCYNNNSKIDTTLISINGYYTIKNIRDRFGLNDCKEHIMDTLYDNLMFFKDGICISDFHAFNSKTISIYFNELKNDSIRNNLFLNSSYWGLYKITGDTIKAQYINHPSITGPWDAWEKWYKIIEKNTIVEIDIKPIETKKELDYFYKYYYDNLKQRFDTARFIPLKTIPSSDCWLKKEKWFWCNEEDWKQYMDSIKQNK